MKYKKWQIVKVKWIDSSGQSSWVSESSIDLDEKFLDIETVGYFLKDCENSIAIAQSYTPPRDIKSVDHVMQIPKVAIKRISKL